MGPVMIFSANELHLICQNAATVTTASATTPTITAISTSTAAASTSTTAIAKSFETAIYQQNNFFIIFLDLFIYLSIILMKRIRLILPVDFSYSINNLNLENSILFYSFIVGRILI